MLRGSAGSARLVVGAHVNSMKRIIAMVEHWSECPSDTDACTPRPMVEHHHKVYYTTSHHMVKVQMRAPMACASGCARVKELAGHLDSGGNVSVGVERVMEGSLVVVDVGNVGSSEVCSAVVHRKVPAARQAESSQLERARRFESRAPTRHVETLTSKDCTHQEGLREMWP